MVNGLDSALHALAIAISLKDILQQAAALTVPFPKAVDSTRLSPADACRLL